MKALISIDYTYDFVADDGELTTGKAGQVIEQAVTTHTKKLKNKPMSIGLISGITLLLVEQI